MNPRSRALQTRRRRGAYGLRMLAIAATAMVSGCGGDGGIEPVSGPALLTVTLRAPASPATGAVRLRLTGVGISGVAAAFPGYTVFSHNVSASEIQAVVAGTLAAGPLITADVASGSGTFTAQVIEAATTADAAIDALAGYDAVVTVTPIDP